MTPRSPKPGRARAWMVARARRATKRLVGPDLDQLRVEVEHLRALQTDPDAQLREDPILALGRLSESIGAIHQREQDLVVRFDMIGPHLAAIERSIARLTEQLQAMQARQNVIDERTDRLAGARWDHEAVHRRLAVIEDQLADRDSSATNG